MQTKYAKRFKIEAVKKVLLRRQGASISSIARTLDIKISTLHGWIKNMENKKRKEDPTSGEKIQKSPYRRTVKERFEIIVEASNLSQQEIAKYCRKKGVFPYHLEKWKAEFVESFGKEKAKSMRENKKLRTENKTLLLELQRKDKALAEAAALLILKKKANSLWGAIEEC